MLFCNWDTAFQSQVFRSAQKMLLYSANSTRQYIWPLWHRLHFMGQSVYQGSGALVGRGLPWQEWLQNCTEPWEVMQPSCETECSLPLGSEAAFLHCSVQDMNEAGLSSSPGSLLPLQEHSLGTLLGTELSCQLYKWHMAIMDNPRWNPVLLNPIQNANQY